MSLASRRGGTGGRSIMNTRTREARAVEADHLYLQTVGDEFGCEDVMGLLQRASEAWVCR